jgi:hypothetical protein
MGLAELEEVDAEAWFAGTKTDGSLASVTKAIDHFSETQTHYRTAAAHCAQYQKWYPAERREEVTPDIDFFHQAIDYLEVIIGKLKQKSLPDLSEIHNLSAAIRNEAIVAERKGLAHRGTRRHFPAGHS